MMHTIQTTSTIWLECCMFLLAWYDWTLTTIYKHVPAPSEGSQYTSMAWRKTAVTPLLSHWSYCRLALNHRDDWCRHCDSPFHGWPTCDLLFTSNPEPGWRQWTSATGTIKDGRIACTIVTYGKNLLLDYYDYWLARPNSNSFDLSVFKKFEWLAWNKVLMIYFPKPETTMFHYCFNINFALYHLRYLKGNSHLPGGSLSSL